MMNNFSSDFRTKHSQLVDMMKNTYFNDHDDIRQSWSKSTYIQIHNMVCIYYGK